MKKSIGLIFIGLVLTSVLLLCVYAKSDSNTGEIKEKINEFRNRIKENKGWFEVEGKTIKIGELSDEKKEIAIGKINAKTGLNLTIEDIGNGTLGQILRAYLSNGRYAIVKIMPDSASAIALKNMKAKCLDRNCSVELKEIKDRDGKSRLVYEIETEKDSTILLIFGKKARMRAQVDAETGEIVSVKKPWWSFMAKEKDDNDKEIDDELGINNETQSGNETTGKVLLCHVPPGNPKAAHRISVGKSAVPAHMAHGDYYGECTGKSTNTTAVNNTATGNETGNSTQ